nr:MAG TPA: Ribosome, CHIMERIC HYBRID STATE RIBOSOME [Caudoviricetes sp.]
MLYMLQTYSLVLLSIHPEYFPKHDACVLNQ